MIRNQKLFVIYRDNSVFRNFVPQLLEGLEVVDTYIVPQGTKPDDVLKVATSAMERARENGANIIISDITCTNLAYKERSVGYPTLLFSDIITLDFIFKSQISKWKPKNTMAENFAWFARQITKNRKIKSIVVVESQIADHRLAGSDDKNQLRKTSDRSEWIVNQLRAIFPKCIIRLVKKLPEALELASDPETLLVLDRHCGIKNTMSNKNGWYDSLDNWPYPSMLYLLPFETCAANLMSQGNFEFEFNIEDMRQELAQNLNS